MAKKNSSSNPYKQGNKPGLSRSAPRSNPAAASGDTSIKEPGGFIGWLSRNPRLLGWLELFAAIVLVGLAVNGFLAGELYLPFAFGLIGLRFFYAYVQHYFEVNFGRAGMVLNLVLLLGGLVCVILGLKFEYGSN